MYKMTPEQVADRRQTLNEMAYFAVLKALLASGQTSSLGLTVKLRKELNITSQQHKQWFEDLRIAQQQGMLPHTQLQQQPMAQAAASYQMGMGVPVQSVPAGRMARQNSKAATHQPATAVAAYQQQPTAAYQQQPAYQQPAHAYHQQHVMAQQPQPVVAQQPQAQEQLNAEMVGYKAMFFWTSNRVWQEGVITRYVPPNICITFNMNKPTQIDEWIKWEQSDHFKMKPERVPMEQIAQYRASRGLPLA